MATSNKSGKTNEELMTPLTNLINKGRREGVLASSEVLAALEKLDLSVEKIEQVYDTFESMGIQILSAEPGSDDAMQEIIEDIDLVADITHYCIKGLEVPFIYGRLGHGMTEETSKPLVAKVVYGALGKRINNV